MDPLRPELDGELLFVGPDGEEHALSLEGPRSSVELYFKREVICVSGRAFPLADPARRYCVGNFCWHGVRLTEDEAGALLRWLAGRGFKPTEWSEVEPVGSWVKELWP